MGNVSSPQAPRTGILAYFTRHKTAANLLLVLMLSLGIISSGKIRSQFFPDVVVETVTVSVAWPGAGPEEVDSAIVAVLEPALLSIEGVESSSAASKDGSAAITLFLEPGWDMGRATEDVKAAVDSVRTLPDTAEEPVVKRGIWRDKVTEVLISGPIAPEQLGKLGDEFVARLFREGITRTQIQGVAAPLIKVMVPEVSRIRNDIQLQEIAGAIAKQAQTSPAGDVAGGAARVRAGVAQRTAEDIQSIVLRTNPDGSKLYVRNVAKVEVEGSDAGRAYFDGEFPAVLIRVDRSEQGDAISMQATVQAVADEFQLMMPKDVSVRLVNSRAEDITDRLDILLENGIMGLGLVLMMLFLFLSARTAFWVALGIPVSMLAAIGVMYVGGLTINMMSLFALIITLGIVVDDAIVVAEHADFRARHKKESPVTASINAARRMAGPVFSSTVTTVLAFFGLMFVGGSFGRLIADIPLTVIAVLIASLIEVFLILPNHMSHALAASNKQHWYDLPSQLFNAGFSKMRASFFLPFMGWVIRLRYPVLALMILILTSSLSMVIKGDVTWRFFTPPETGSITGNLSMLPGATREDTTEMARELQRAVAAVADSYEEEYGVNPVVHALVQVGGTTGRGLPGADTKDPDQLGAIDIGLIDADLRTYSSTAFVTDLQQEVNRLPLLELMSFRSVGSGPGGDSLNVNFYGADSFVLKAAAEDLIAQLSQMPELSGLEDSLPYGKTDLVLQLTPQGEALGFTIDGLGSELFARLNGITAAEFPAGVRSSKVIVQLPEAELTADFLVQTLMRTPQGQYVPLVDIVTVESSLGFSTVQRANGLRLITVSGSISEDNPARAVEIGVQLETEILPQIADLYNVEWDLGGLASQEADFLSEALVGFALCLLGIYLTLSWVFGSWSSPLVVLAIIPFGLIGTIWGHYAWDIPMSLFTIIGIIGMSGIIINDSIVLVSTIHEYSAKQGVIRAAINATNDRLRPIMLTTLTTVLGLAPLMYESSRQALFLKPTVITLVFGLAFGFFVVLLIVPSLVVIHQDISLLLKSTRKVMFGRLVPAQIRHVMILVGAVIIALNVGIIGYWVINDTLIAPLRPIADVATILSGGILSYIAAAIASATVIVVTAILTLTHRKRPNS